MNGDARKRRDRVATKTQIELLVEGVREVLGDDLVGAYLHGSAVLGGFRPDSDVDIIIVSERRTTADEKRRLIDLLLSISGARASLRPGRPIELDIVVESEVRPWRYPQHSIFITTSYCASDSRVGNLNRGRAPQIRTSLQS
jgi:streptomycin 3"-adenylyltransferase